MKLARARVWRVYIRGHGWWWAYRTPCGSVAHGETWAEACQRLERHVRGWCRDCREIEWVRGKRR